LPANAIMASDVRKTRRAYDISFPLANVQQVNVPETEVQS
jgi:hypothetical protein